MPPRFRHAAFAISLLMVSAACQAQAAARGDPERGKQAIEHYGCVSCHVIPGIDNPGSNVAPPLREIGTRSYIAGVLPNTFENMVRWLQDPPKVDPRTAMPNMGITEKDARDIAAYLYTLK